MTAALGNYVLSAAVLASAAALVAALGGGRFRSAGWLAAARLLLAAVAGLFTVCAAALAAAILGDEFGVSYVANYSERALPVGYKLAAFWAGQAGSLLLWAWMIAVLGFIGVAAARNRDAAEQAGACGTLAVIAGFFAVLMMLAPDANPFSPSLAEDPATGEMVAYTPADGQGLNPMLQDPAMMAHPPTLFLGYAGFAVTFALMVGGLVAGRMGGDWLMRVRRWALASWVLLGIGILLGSWWAYVELGWGGYWAWDPVENASLLPWLTGTALLHAMVVQRSRGLFKAATAALIAATFLLCLLGTWLTRSGVIQSVHSFGKSDVGMLLAAFLGAMTVGSAALLVWRREALRPDAPAAAWRAREWVFFAVAMLLVTMAAFTAVGTLRPLLGEAAGGARLAVAQDFYNHYVLELLGLPLAALVVFGPLAAYGRKETGWPVRMLAAGGAAAAVAVAAAASVGIREFFALAAAAIAAGAPAVMIADLVRSLSARRRATGERLPAAALALVAADGRRYGAQAAHLGAVLILLGIVGSSLYGTEEVVRLAEGRPVSAGRYTLALRGLEDVRLANYGATEAAVEVTWPGGRPETLRPQQRRYDKSPDMVSHEIALASGLREDLYLALAGGDEKGEAVFVKVLVKPLLIWIWIGGIVMTLGGLVPRVLARLASARRAAPACAAGGDRAVPGACPPRRVEDRPRRTGSARAAALRTGRV